MTSTAATVREQVRQRADARCEYCRKPEAVSTYPHHVEHIIARKHGGSSDLENLAWACFQCNVSKGSDIASYDIETRELTPFFNPRQQDWYDHFDLVEAEIIGKTPVGRVTVRLLQMNHPEEIEVRRQLILAGWW
jgi:hypothetical protein